MTDLLSVSQEWLAEILSQIEFQEGKTVQSLKPVSGHSFEQLDSLTQGEKILRITQIIILDNTFVILRATKKLFILLKFNLLYFFVIW